MTEPDPLFLVPEALAYAKVSESTLRRDYRRPESDPRHLRVIKQYGQIKIRLSWLDDWIARTAEDAA